MREGKARNKGVQTGRHKEGQRFGGNIEKSRGYGKQKLSKKGKRRTEAADNGKKSSVGGPTSGNVQKRKIRVKKKGGKKEKKGKKGGHSLEGATETLVGDVFSKTIRGGRNAPIGEERKKTRK